MVFGAPFRRLGRYLADVGLLVKGANIFAPFYLCK
jgi:hypothetical protein